MVYGLRCPTCAKDGKEVWMIPGRYCGYCGTPCDSDEYSNGPHDAIVEQTQAWATSSSSNSQTNSFGNGNLPSCGSSRDESFGGWSWGSRSHSAAANESTKHESDLARDPKFFAPNPSYQRKLPPEQLPPSLPPMRKDDDMAVVESVEMSSPGPSTQSFRDSATQPPKPLLQDALEYLNLVKTRFHDDPTVYTKYLEVMEDFQNEKIHTPAVINWILEHFAGHADLIEGFSTFLPQGYKLNCETNSYEHFVRLTTPMGTIMEATPDYRAHAEQIQETQNQEKKPQSTLGPSQNEAYAFQDAEQERNLQILRTIGQEVQRRFNQDGPPNDCFATNSKEYNNTLRKLRLLEYDMSKLEKDLGKWYGFTKDDERARQFFWSRLWIRSQFSDGDRMQVPCSYLSITASELDKIQACLEGMAKDIAHPMGQQRIASGESSMPTGLATPGQAAASSYAHRTSPAVHAEEENLRNEEEKSRVTMLETSQQGSNLIHMLAQGEQSSIDLQSRWGGKPEDFQAALATVAEYMRDTHKWALRKAQWRRLDVWSHDYEPAEREQAIKNAIKQYDEQGLSSSEPEWERLNPPEDRGKGICLSRLQVNLAKGPTPAVPRINVHDAEGRSATNDQQAVTATDESTVTKAKSSFKQSSGRYESQAIHGPSTDAVNYAASDSSVGDETDSMVASDGSENAALGCSMKADGDNPDEMLQLRAPGLRPSPKDENVVGSFELPPPSSNLVDQEESPFDVETFTDSGYASILKNKTMLKDGIDTAGSVVSATKNSPRQTSKVNDDDDATVYSVAWSVAEEELDSYKSEISEALHNGLCLHIGNSKLAKSLTSALPALLKSFALRLGCPGSSKEEKQVMYFIHKHRSDIASRFNDVAKGSFDEDATTNFGRSSKGTVEPWDINLWLQEIGHEDDGKSDKQQAKVDWENPGLMLDFGDEPDEEISLPDKRGYRDVVFNSVAYKWLMAALAKTLVFEPLQEDSSCARIRSKVTACIDQNRSISSRRASERYSMVFVAEWNPVDFLRDQFPNDPDLGRLLVETLAVTGDGTDAQILPCAEYLSQTWPTTGPQVLELLKAALCTSKKVTGELQDKSSITFLFRRSYLDISVEGTADTIAEIGEQIGWLGSALRRSCSESGIAICQPHVRISTQDTGRHVCKLSFTVEDYTTNAECSSSGQCWHELFRNPVVVTGYPIPRRSLHNSGLEIPLSVMSGLTACPRVNNYQGRHFLKGFATALAPTAKLNDTILWHLYYSKDGSRLPYPDMGDMNPVDIDLRDLTKRRHIIGWCSEAKFFAGAPDMNYKIRPSQLARPGRDFALEKVSFSVGEIVTGGCQFAIGRKDSHVRVTRGSFKAKLEWLDQKHITLWDVSEERGWLINGAAALLHLLRTSLASSKVDKFRSEFLFKEEEFEESPNPLTLDSALEVLLNNNNQKLELYPKDEHSFTETRLLPNGQRETITKTISSRTTIKDRTEELYETLEKLIDHHASTEASYKGVDSKIRLSDHLEGWDFVDIATDRDPFYIRKANLPIHLLSWVDFTRAIPAITLFGKGFGEIIQAARQSDGGEGCAKWETVPTNKHLLCVGVSDLRDIVDRIGDQWASPISMAPGILWNNPLKDSPFQKTCLCESSSKKTRKHHHPIQEVISTKLRFSMSDTAIDLSEHQNGAVIFGPKPGWKVSWGSSSSPQVLESRSSTDAALGNSGTSQESTTGDFSTSLLTASSSSLTEMAAPSPGGPASGDGRRASEGVIREEEHDIRGSMQDCSTSPRLKRKASDCKDDDANKEHTGRPSRLRKIARSIEKRLN